MSRRTRIAVACACGLVVMLGFAQYWASWKEARNANVRMAALLEQVNIIRARLEELMTPTKAETTIDCPRLGSGVKTTVTSFKQEGETAAEFAARHVEEVAAMQTACEAE